MTFLHDITARNHRGQEPRTQEMEVDESTVRLCHCATVMLVCYTESLPHCAVCSKVPVYRESEIVLLHCESHTVTP